MSDEPETGGGGVSATPATMAAFGIILVIFTVIPQTRPAALLVVWIAGPLVAFGSLVQVFRGTLGLRSTPTIIFALVCAVVGFVTIPLGFVVVSDSLAQVLQFGGFAAAIVAIVFARVAVYDDPTTTDRYVPPVDTDGPDPFVAQANSDGEGENTHSESESDFRPE